MTSSVRAYRAICFDLDGTLLPMDLDQFLGGYFSGLAKFAAEQGFDAPRFIDALKAGTKAMSAHDPQVTNEQAYWETFAAVYGEGKETVLPIMDTFYEEVFPHIGEGCSSNPLVPGILETLAKKGYPLLLTTMPMFPRIAVEHRLAWAGVDASVFARITSYENSCATKPKHIYFAENIAAMCAEDDEVCGADILMVGNNTNEDLAFCDLGADGYIITDCLLNPLDMDMDAVKHGSMEEFAAWVDALAPCENPVRLVQQGAIDPQATAQALAANETAPDNRELVGY